MDARNFMSHPIEKMKICLQYKKIFVANRNTKSGAFDSESVYCQNKHCIQIRICNLYIIMFVNPLWMRLAKVNGTYIFSFLSDMIKTLNQYRAK